MENIFQIVFSGIVAISTVVYAILTWRLVRETRMMRQFQITPDIQVYFDRGETRSKYLYINIINKGIGTAKNVQFKIIKNLTTYQTDYFNISEKGVIKNGLQFFYTNQNFRYLLLNINSDNYSQVNSEELQIQVNYIDITSQKHERMFKLYPKEFMGMGVINPPDSYLGRVAHYTEKIDKSLQNIKNSIDTITESNELDSGE